MDAGGSQNILYYSYQFLSRDQFKNFHSLNYCLFDVSDLFCKFAYFYAIFVTSILFRTEWYSIYSYGWNMIKKNHKM